MNIVKLVQAVCILVKLWCKEFIRAFKHEYHQAIANAKREHDKAFKQSFENAQRKKYGIR